MVSELAAVRKKEDWSDILGNFGRVWKLISNIVCCTIFRSACCYSRILIPSSVISYEVGLSAAYPSIFCR